jgi:hypothetical protein
LQICYVRHGQGGGIPTGEQVLSLVVMTAAASAVWIMCGPVATTAGHFSGFTLYSKPAEVWKSQKWRISSLHVLQLLFTAKTSERNHMRQFLSFKLS